MHADVEALPLLASTGDAKGGSDVSGRSPWRLLAVASLCAAGVFIGTFGVFARGGLLATLGAPADAFPTAPPARAADASTAASATPTPRPDTFPRNGPGRTLHPNVTQAQLRNWHARRDPALAEHDRARFPDGASMPHRPLETPVLVMALDSPGEDEKVSGIFRTVAAHHGDTAANLRSRGVLRRVAGVNAYAWPDRIEDAAFAVKSIEAVLEAQPNLGRRLIDLSWIGDLATARTDRRLRGRFPEEHAFLGHHAGCLFGHMRQWQTAKELDVDAVIVLESDALSSGLTTPPSAWQDAVDRLPSDFDLAFINHHGAGPGALVDTFEARGWLNGVAGGEHPRYQIFRWDRDVGAAGLQGYVASRKFVNEIFHKIAWDGGADMVDAWLMGRMCGTRDPDGNLKLTCYHVVPAKGPNALKAPSEWLGGVVTRETTEEASKAGTIADDAGAASERADEKKAPEGKEEVPRGKTVKVDGRPRDAAADAETVARIVRDVVGTGTGTGRGDGGGKAWRGSPREEALAIARALAPIGGFSVRVEADAEM